jgi:hypothetical protein
MRMVYLLKEQFMQMRDSLQGRSMPQMAALVVLFLQRKRVKLPVSILEIHIWLLYLIITVMIIIKII